MSPAFGFRGSDDAEPNVKEVDDDFGISGETPHSPLSGSALARSSEDIRKELMLASRMP